MLEAIRSLLGLAPADVALGGPKPTEARSPHWPAVRRMHLAQQPECQVCGTREHVEAHHVQPFHLRPDLELSLDNLLTLCPTHHLWWGHLGNWKSFNALVRRDAELWRAKIKGRP